jgi:integrase
VTGKNVRLGLPEGSLKEARDIAKAHRAAVANGRDPAMEARTDLTARQEAHARLATVADALDRYEKAVVEPAPKLASRRKRMRALRRAMSPMTDRPVANLTRGDMIRRLDEIQSGSGDVSRNRAHSEMRHFLGWCRDREIAPTNVLDRVRRGVKEVARERVLSDAEVGAVLAVTRDGSAYCDIVRTLLHTAVRRDEAASLQPRDLDFDAKTITVRAEVAKTRQARVIPLDDAIGDMLRQRARGLKRESYVFGDGSNFERPFSGFSKRFASLSKSMPEGTERWTLHDLRRTVATRLHEAGTDALVVEDLLGHLSGVRSGVAGIYNRAGTLERKREALKAWSAKLSAMDRMRTEAAETGGASGNVVMLKRKRLVGSERTSRKTA